jgi:ATP-binding cassette, subfamily B, bacterial MsbA
MTVPLPTQTARLRRLIPYFRGTGLYMQLLVLATVRGIAGFVAQYSLARMANQAMVTLRGTLFGRLLDAPMSLFGQTSASTLSNTVVYEVQTGTTLLVNAMLSLIKDSLTLVALMAYLLYINWKLTLIVLVIFPGVALVMKVLSKRLHRITRASQDATDRLAYVVEENVLAHRVVRLHEAQHAQGERFGHLNRELRRLAMKSTVAASAMTPLTQMLAAAALSAVICTALWQSSTSGITVGGFASFVTAMLMLIAPIKHLSEVASPITRGLAAVERGLDLIETTPAETEGKHEVAHARGELALEKVSVRYAGSSTDALDAVSLHVKPGQTVALVGSSGSGKTTLVNLLPRFVEPTAGRILLDGVKLHQWKLSALRRQFSFVSQDVVMFNDSIAANVTLGLPPDRARIEAALDAANLRAHVDSLPQGMDTVVGHNATQLSGGQRQRLAIARALYKNAPILVLDEATSALDTESEQAVKSALQRLMAGRTTLIIAHRLSTIEHADRILVMSAGRIVEEGSHDELLRRNGHYARLYNLAVTTDLDTTQESILQ